MKPRKPWRKVCFWSTARWRVMMGEGLIPQCQAWSTRWCLRHALEAGPTWSAAACPQMWGQIFDGGAAEGAQKRGSRWHMTERRRSPEIRVDRRSSSCMYPEGIEDLSHPKTWCLQVSFPDRRKYAPGLTELTSSQGLNYEAPMLGIGHHFEAKLIITHITFSLVQQWPHDSTICIDDTTAHSIKLVSQQDKTNYAPPTLLPK